MLIVKYEFDKMRQESLVTGNNETLTLVLMLAQRLWRCPMLRQRWNNISFLQGGQSTGEVALPMPTIFTVDTNEDRFALSEQTQQIHPTVGPPSQMVDKR